MDISNLAQIVAFVLPGYLAAQVSDLLVRNKKRDDFERLAVSLFFSLLAYTIVCASGAACSRFRDGWQLSHEISLQNWPFVLGIFGVALVIGSLWGLTARSRLLTDCLRRIGVFYSHYPNVWNSLWENDCKALVIARLEDGSEFRGVLRRFSNDPDQQSQEVWLYPVFVRTEGGDYEEDPGLSVYIPGDRLLSISAYRDEDLEEATRDK